MKKVTYGMPKACANCGNEDHAKMSFDWSNFFCLVCKKTTPYEVVKTEEISDTK